MKEILAALSRERRELFCGGLKEDVVKEIWCRVNNVNSNLNKQSIIINPT